MFKNSLKKVLLFAIVTSFIFSTECFSATVIKKEDASMYSKKSIYSEIDVSDNLIAKDDGTGLRQNDDALNKFTCVTATKDGNTYTNRWSNYTVTFDDEFHSANDVYDFNGDGIKFDFGVYFADYSRIAIYYSRLSRDLNVVAANFSPGAQITDVVIGEETYKHVSLDVPYPYGIEKYDYYLRNVDGKLMVIELYWEEGSDICQEYLDKIQKVK